MMRNESFSELYVMGGKQKPDAGNKEEWFRYERGLLLKIDALTGECQTCFTYQSPPEARPDDEHSCIFKAGTVTKDEILLCTQTEILRLNKATLEQVGYLTLPCLNDVHHITVRSSGSYLIANTGLDMVLEVTPAGELLRMWNVLGENPWERFSPGTDYRKIATTKPHHAHPNFVFEVDEEIWVTRFEQRDAVSLTRPGRRIDIGVERPHDGILHGDFIYFTTVDGHVVIADPHRAERLEVINLNDVCETEMPLGWCRSIAVLEEHQVIVGFSRLRHTRFRENVRWAKYKLGVGRARLLPSRIARLDLKERRVLWEFNVEEHDMAAIFSIHVEP